MSDKSREEFVKWRSGITDLSIDAIWQAWQEQQKKIDELEAVVIDGDMAIGVLRDQVKYVERLEREKEEAVNRLKQAVISHRHSHSKAWNKRNINWSMIGYLFGCGSTTAYRWCEKLGVDPEKYSCSWQELKEERG